MHDCVHIPLQQVIMGQVQKDLPVEYNVKDISRVRIANNSLGKKSKPHAKLRTR